jgi:hypothetical protein
VEKKNPAKEGRWQARPGTRWSRGSPVRYPRGTRRARVRRRDPADRRWWFCPVIQRAMLQNRWSWMASGHWASTGGNAAGNTGGNTADNVECNPDCRPQAPRSRRIPFTSRLCLSRLLTSARRVGSSEFWIAIAGLIATVISSAIGFYYTHRGSNRLLSGAPLSAASGNHRTSTGSRK